MTSIVTPRQETLTGLEMVYPERPYSLGTLGTYLITLNDTWLKCGQLSLHRIRGEATFNPQDIDIPPAEGETSVSPLAIIRLRLESPMALDLANQSGPTIVTIYALHLFVQILRDPKRIGEWIPTLVAGWHTAWRKAARAQELRYRLLTSDNPTRPLVDATKQLHSTGICPKKITVVGAGTPPDELTGPFA